MNMEPGRKAWWQKPLRVIQTNLQMKDTALIDPERYASQMKQLGANAVVFNVGGIYAWYPTKVAYHTVNEYLPASYDLLEEVIRACHKQQLRFIARFDFSKAEDTVYQQRPEWFIRKPSGEPEVIGAERPGNWSLLMSTCLNGAYRNEAVALPVLDEVLRHYPVDAVFFNAPRFVPCWCESCRRKYAEQYHKPLPEAQADWEPGWGPSCFRDNADAWYRLIKSRKPEVPMMLYLYPANMLDRHQPSDVHCTEPQDILSLGHRHIPEFWKPALSMKLARSLPGRPVPLGIVHSSPGMDWRHTGLPPAEYRFWLAQIPAHGGSIWHSLTGIPETITDKRILETVGDFNRSLMKVESCMEDAVAAAQIALLWTGDASAEGWADGLINRQVPFDVLLGEHATPERLSCYRGLIVPEGAAYTDTLIENIRSYVREGGQLIAEGASPQRAEVYDLLGVTGEVYRSEDLSAAYIRLAGEDNPLGKGLEGTELLPYRGTMLCTRPATEQVEVLATLVPPFSPMESVGAPPERASLAVSRTDLPLALRQPLGKGYTLYFPFSLSHLIKEYKLAQHEQLLENAVRLMLGGEKLIEISQVQGLQLTVFEKERRLLIHLVNGAGRRPLAVNLPLHGIQLKVRTNGRRVKRVDRLITEQELGFELDGSYMRFEVPRLDIWECLCIEFE